MTKTDILTVRVIYIFDESLSQIDIKSERKILKNIFEKLKNNTVIVISHRFNNSDMFDECFKIESGRVKNGLVKV